MLNDFELRFSQHDETIRRAESKARLLTELAGTRGSSASDPDRLQRRLATLIRRLAGSAATAA
jgi:hypothetical protein